MQLGLYATQDYDPKHGKPSSLAEFRDHHFVGIDDPKSRAPFYKWLNGVVPRENLSFRATDAAAIEQAVKLGVGIGFLPKWFCEDEDNMVEVWPSQDEWHGAVWLVTHVDLHRTVKVQAFLNFLKDKAKDWVI